MWSEGTIGIPNGDGSVFGIDGGRISKLTIKVGGKVTCNYDRGWDIEPADDATVKALAILMHDYN